MRRADEPTHRSGECPRYPEAPATDTPTDRQGSPTTSIAVINYNGADVLPATMAGIEAVGSTAEEVLLVDDGSDDGSPEWVEEHHPGVEVIRMGRNTGRLNQVRNVALRRARSQWLFLMDNDIVLREGCIERLQSVLQSRRDVLCCTPRLVYRRDPGLLYHDGGGLHFLCLSTAVPRGEPVAEHPPGDARPSLSGGIMLIDRTIALELGGFDEEYMRGWGDDCEFQLRGRLTGRAVLHVPKAVCEHVDRPHGSDRLHAQIYNRYRMLATVYSGRSLALLVPPLLVFELALTVMAVLKGFLGLRLSGALRALRDTPGFLRRRAEVQAGRTVPDSDFLEGGSLMRPPAMESSRLVRLGASILSGILELYWWLVRPWL